MTERRGMGMAVVAALLVGSRHAPLAALVEGRAAGAADHGRYSQQRWAHASARQRGKGEAAATKDRRGGTGRLMPGLRRSSTTASTTHKKPFPCK